ncbi:MAG: hypothetical protein GC199_10785 [Alphaproteobacteria bacterium]|nr:hypothetical protein [Alphaproteobacteria bacterium]
MIHRLSTDGALPPPVRPAPISDGHRPGGQSGEPQPHGGPPADPSAGAAPVSLSDANRAAIEAAIVSIEPSFDAGRSRLSIDRDDQVERFIYRSIDRETGEVLGQWPADQVLHAMRHLREVEGLIVDAKA